MLLLILCMEYKSDFTLQKSFSHHFHVQITAKMVIFHLFQDILTIYGFELHSSE